MSSISALRFLRYGMHSSTSDWTTMPGSLTFLEPEGEVTIDSKPRHVDRAGVQRGNGQRVLRKTVGKMTDGVPSIEIALRGLSGSGAGAGSTSALTHDLDGILTNIFGVKTEGVGDTFSGTPGSGTTLTMDGATTHAVATGVLILGATSGKYVARQITSVNASTILIDRALTTDAGAADTPTASSIAYGGRAYSLTTASPQRTHFALDAEGEGYRNQVTGCMSSATISFAGGDIAKITLDGIKFTDITDDDELTPAVPTWATPTRGKPICVIDAPMWIGGTAYMTMGGLDINLGLTISPRGGNGPNGPFGYVVSKVEPTLTWTMVAGTLTSPTEITDTILATLRNDTAKDVAFQFGREVGGTAYIRAPALEISCERTTVDGVEAISCTARPTDASEVALNSTDHQLHMILF